MNRHEKIAWFNLVLFSVSVLLYCALFFFLRTRYPLDICLRVSFAAFALCGIMAFGPMIFKSRPGKDCAVIDERDVSETLLYEPGLDERDLLIQRRARLHGFGAFWGVFGLLLMGTWMWKRYVTPPGTGSVTIILDVDVLPLIFMGGFLVITVAHAISTIMQYRNERLADSRFENDMTENKRFIFFILGFFTVFTAANFFLMSRTGGPGAILGMMLNLGIVYFFLHTLKADPGGNFFSGDLRILKIAGWLTGTLFTVLYLVSLFAVWAMFREFGAVGPMAAPLFILVFGTMILMFTVIPDLRKYFRESRHEKT